MEDRTIRILNRVAVVLGVVTIAVLLGRIVGIVFGLW